MYDCDMNPVQRKLRFIQDIRADSLFHILFDHLRDVCLFAKDVEGHLLVVNRALVKRFGLRDEREMIGKTDYDLHPRGHAEKYRIDDRRVMESGKPMLNIVELFLDVEGIPTWHVTNKMPVFSRDGRVIANWPRGSILLKGRGRLGPCLEQRGFDAVAQRCSLKPSN